MTTKEDALLLSDPISLVDSMQTAAVLGNSEARSETHEKGPSQKYPSFYIIAHMAEEQDLESALFASLAVAYCL